MVAIVAVAALALGAFALGGVLSTGSAGAIPTLEITTAGGVCDTATGEYDIQWQVKNVLPGDFTPTSALVYWVPLEPTDVFSQFPPGAMASGSTVIVTLTLPGSTTGEVQLLVEGNGLGQKTVEFPTPSTCVVATVPALQVGPSAAGPGEAVTISGTACGFTPSLQSAGVAGVVGTVTGSVAFTPPLAFGPITAGADGAWSTSVVVPAGTPPGSYAVSASCAFPEPPDAESNAAVRDSVPASVRGQVSAGFAYETKYLTVVPAAVVAAPRTTG